MKQAFQLAKMSGIRLFVPFHHDPAHDDDHLDKMIAQAIDEVQPKFQITPGKEMSKLNLE